ncbi:MAG: 30S ribosome-binding factor RbfA [Thermodesulfatator sp.]|nr:MAG: 30S ribosome-binding factor RbfA [Thermodesulfatator sp.]
MDYEIFEGLLSRQPAFSRSERVADLLKEEVARMLLSEVKDPRVQGLVTVISVKVTKDLRHANFSVSVIGGLKEERAAIKGLDKASGFIRRSLGKRLRMRRIPELHFRLDETLKAQEKIEGLLRKIHEEG